MSGKLWTGSWSITRAAVRARGLGVVCAMLIATVGVTSFDVAAGVVSGGGPTVSAAPSGVLRSVNPVRLLDTRPGQPTIDKQFAGIGRAKAGSVTEVQIAGRGGIAKNAPAALLNLTAVLPSGPTYLTAYPCGTKPNASNINLAPGDIRANSVYVKLSATGTVCVYTVAATDILIDAQGYLPANAPATSIAPSRLLDTRPGQPTIDGQYAAIGQAKAGSVTEIQIAGRAGIPATATSAMLNLTAVFPNAPTYLTAYPCGTKPNASNINLDPGDIRANNVFVQLSNHGTVCIYTVAPVDIIVDANGYVTGASPASVTPARLLDTRPGQPTIDGQYAGIGKAKPGSITEVQIAGRGGIPANAASALINLTAVQPDAGTYLTVYGCGNKPNASNINLAPGDIRANSVYVKLSNTGSVCIYTVAATNVIIDASGYATQAACTIDGTQINTTLSAEECSALLALYRNNNGKNWKTKRGWNTKTDPCTWSGVACYNGHVYGLYLSGNNVRGAVTHQIGNLIYLRELLLDQNAITSVPPTIGNLRGLTIIWLYSNKVTSIPPEIGNLTNIDNLNLSSNNLSGLPTEVRNLTNLKRLGLSNNLLTQIPNTVFGFPKLTELWIGGNSITSVSDRLGNLGNLEVLSLASNALTTVPASIGKLGRLRSLDLYGNKIVSLPAEMGTLASLDTLYLGSNSLTKVPNWLQRLPNLTRLSINNNRLEGDITSPFQRLQQANKLTVLALRGNRCLTTGDASLRRWLRGLDPTWNDGC